MTEQDVEIKWFCDIDECFEHCTLVQSKLPTIKDCKKQDSMCRWTAVRWVRCDDVGKTFSPDYVKWLRKHGTSLDIIMWKEEIIRRGYARCGLSIPCRHCVKEVCELPKEMI